MIKKIESLTDFGIYRSFKASAELQAFKKYNLFYGWNGSGKSTLTRVFSSIGNKSMNSNHFTSDFTVVKSDNGKITKKTLRDHELRVRVFNQDFIEDNIDWNKTVKSILLVSKKSIDDKKDLERLRRNQLEINLKIDSLVKQQENYNKEIKKFLTDKAREIKNIFRPLSIGNNYYQNYEKSRFESYITSNKEKVTDKTSVLSETLLKRLTKSTQSGIKTTITFNKDRVTNYNLVEAEKKIQIILQRKAISDVIDRLKDNADIQQWVEDGLKLYRSHKNTRCEFCNSPINLDRIKELERHFNDEFKDLMEDLNKLYNGLDKFVPTPQFFDKSVLYDEFKDEYSQCMDEYDKVYYNIIQNIESLKEAINNKKSKPFDVIEYDLSFMKGMFDSYKKLLDRITDIVGRHNVKTSTFNAKVKENREKLELHYVAYYVQKGKYFELKKKEANLIPEIDVLKQKRDSIINNISLLERKLSNETLGAEEFNKYLKEFLNRDEISLMYVEEEEGYKIVRSNNSDKAAEALSEGEKTAIAFVYFLVKLTENDEKVEDAIIVIDDPISSFDSNHLFHALSFMTRKCSNAKQLFILTHNFWFFKLVRDWLKKSENRDEKSSFYVIKNTYSEFGREAYLQNCDNSLIKYHSEYHYLFSTLLEYSEKDSLSFVDAYSLGNVCRRLLESFMSFKYPADRNLRKAMESSKYDSEKIERIYYYVQKFSHSDRIEAHENITDNVLGEGKNIITDVLEMIKGLDEVHYNQIIKVCKN